MSKYLKKLPEEPSFEQKGLKGYNYDLECKEITLTIEDSFKGHDYYHTNTHSTKTYYVIEGKGLFKVNGELIHVIKGDVVEIPPKTEFVFAGKMKLLLIMAPAFRPEDGINGKENDLYEIEE